MPRCVALSLANWLVLYDVSLLDEQDRTHCPCRSGRMCSRSGSTRMSPVVGGNCFPNRRNADGSPATPQSHELGMLTVDEDAFAERHRRLADLSWFMRCLSEPIARRQPGGSVSATAKIGTSVSEPVRVSCRGSLSRRCPFWLAISCGLISLEGLASVS